MSDGEDKNWLDLSDSSDVTVCASEVQLSTAGVLRWKLLPECGRWDLTFRIKIKNDQKTE